MSIAHNISAFNRARKWKRFCSLFEIDENVKILDIGFGENELSPPRTISSKNTIPTRTG